MLIAAQEIAAPEVRAWESVERTGTGVINAANAVAAASTTGITTVGGKQMPAAIRGSVGCAEGQAAQFHNRIVRALSHAGGAHPDTGASNASPLRTVESRRHTLDGHS